MMFEQDFDVNDDDFGDYDLFSGQEDVFYIDDLFFIKKHAIKTNQALVQRTFQDLYEFVSYN